MNLEEKIKCLEKRGYRRIDPDLLEGIKKNNYKKYVNFKYAIEFLKRKGKEPILVMICENKSNFYSNEYIENKTIKEIIEGTQRFLSSFK